MTKSTFSAGPGYTVAVITTYDGDREFEVEHWPVIGWLMDFEENREAATPIIPLHHVDGLGGNQKFGPITAPDGRIIFDGCFYPAESKWPCIVGVEGFKNVGADTLPSPTPAPTAAPAEPVNPASFRPNGTKAAKPRSSKTATNAADIFK